MNNGALVGGLFVAVLILGGCAIHSGAQTRAAEVPLSPAVARMEPAAKAIIGAVKAGNGSWSKLEHLTLTIGARLSGSKSLEQAIRWAVDTLVADGHDNVRAEPVMVPHWERGHEGLVMVSPGRRSLPLLGLGGTVATPLGGLTADVEVVTSEKELKALGSRVRGKLLLLNTPMPAYDPVKGSGYGQVVKYRYLGPRWAASSGAVGVLIRSLTATSLATPHTGGTSYKGVERPVPAAAITIEDAAAIAALRAAGQKVTVKLELGGRDRGWAPSANVTAELVGRELPHEVVVISAHLDSWDVGQGAHDDGGPCVVAMEALRTLRRLGLVPKRTIRVVLWTNEENGIRGALDYRFSHAEELIHHVAGIESDTGAFAPMGYRVQHSDKAAAAQALTWVGQIVQLSAPVGAHRSKLGFSGTDVKYALMDAGVPVLGHWVNMAKYFDYHHTHADTLDKVSPEQLTDNVAAMAIMAYALAELPGRIDGREASPPSDNQGALGWLAGDWESADGRREIWAPPHAGAMIGLGYKRGTSTARRHSYERMRIAFGARGEATLWAHPRGAGGADKPVAFKLSKRAPNGVTFTNPAHDFPKTIAYRRMGDTLRATLSGDGAKPPIELRWTHRGSTEGAGWLGR